MFTFPLHPPKKPNELDPVLEQKSIDMLHWSFSPTDVKDPHIFFNIIQERNTFKA